eukprot:3001104-Pyramimonas_sp.AAC.1
MPTSPNLCQAMWLVYKPEESHVRRAIARCPKLLYQCAEAAEELKHLARAALVVVLRREDGPELVLVEHVAELAQGARLSSAPGGNRDAKLPLGHRVRHGEPSSESLRYLVALLTLPSFA